MNSYQANKGIPRILISKAVEELQNRSKKTKSKIKHEVGLSTINAEKKLPHIFKEFGYKEDYELISEHFGLSKIYSP